MNASAGGSSTLTKMRQVYWEAKQSFNKSLGQQEDGFIVSSDNDLDTRIELLQAADSSFNALMRVILKYHKAIQDLVSTQENFGSTLVGYGTKDSTAAGNIMCMSGKTMSKSAQKLMKLTTNLMNLFHEVETFQFKATTDALQTVAKMERARKSYRSGLMWMKKESTDLDPDVNKKLRNFRKVQEHIKRLKVKFDGVKLETMQKIDLFLLSRTNLFSNILIPYCKAFKKICKYTSIIMGKTLQNIPLCLSYNFVALKELNQYSKILQEALKKEQSLEKKYENRMKADKMEISKSSSSVSSELIYTTSEHSSNFKGTTRSIIESGDIKNNKIRASESPEGISLIDLNGEDSNALTRLLTENKNPSSASFQYSDDLSLINFDNYQTTYENRSPYDNIGKIFEEFLMESDSQGDSTKETDDLKYWSLLQNYDRSSNLKELNNAEINNSGSASLNHSSPATSYSGWNEILVQFDPFLEEMIDPKIKNHCLGSC